MKKALLVKQRDATDCGAACIASICAYYKLKVPVPRVRQYANTNLQGTTVFGIIEATRKLGLDSRAVKGAFASLFEIPLPAIAHFLVSGNRTHFMVVVRVLAKKVVIMDPASGKFRTMTHEAFNSSWTGILILTVPGENFQQDPGISNTSRFLKLAWPHKHLLFRALICSLLMSLLGLSISVFVQEIVDHILIKRDLQTLNILSMVMIMLLAFQVALGFIKDILALRAGQSIDSKLILGYYEHLLRLPQRFYDTMRVGELMSRINDAVRISAFISEVAMNILVNALIVIFSLGIMFFYYWKLALVGLSILPVYIIIAWINDVINKKWQRRLMESFADFDAQLVEYLTAAGTIKKLCLEQYAMNKTGNKFNLVLKNVYRSSIYQLYLSCSADFFTRLFTIIILWTGSYFVLQKYLTAGELLSFYSLIISFTVPLMNLTASSKYIRESMIAADRLFEITDLEREQNDSLILSSTEEASSSIRLNGVHFSYDNAEKILDNINCIIYKNSITGIRGQSGSGKSTLAALLQKLYIPSSGNITIGQTDIGHINTVSLRKRILVVPQHTHLFSGTVTENISIGCIEPDEKKVLDISEKLGITEFVSKLPAGFNTFLSEQGNNLSGGQKQRISIARAIYRDPPILILDEATASLDEESERKILDTMQWYRSKGNTIVIIAHRESTLSICDRILMLENGRII